MRLRDLVTDPCVRRRASSALAALIVALPCLALATPPSWAPAHGWRKKNDPAYAGYSGRSWNDDFGVQSGRCNREDWTVVHRKLEGRPCRSGEVSAQPKDTTADALSVLL